MDEPPADVVVTVGMGRFPFDRLLRAVLPLCGRWRVIAQTGPSTVELPCRQHAYLPADALAELLAVVPIVITHGGNTVRLVQKLGKVPIAAARRADYGEMADDHQVAYLRQEQRHGRVIVTQPDTDAVRHAVVTFPERSADLLIERSVPPAVPAGAVADHLDQLVGSLVERRRRWRRR